ncbi:hypothetical protein [Acetobacter malorum]|uniref:hypothetical protein n=1 Tax=Acetobacter malorum TaxID=178901 RepID=UPI000776BFF4|nr:hypothetical protein [Acetobacter malorum]
MAMTERIVFMPYVWRLRGKKKVLEPGMPVLCRSESDALRWVEKLENGALTAAGGQADRRLKCLLMKLQEIMANQYY